MRPPIRLIHGLPMEDVEQACRQLLEDAIKGRLVGLAFSAQYKRRTYIVHAVGELRRNPTWARGTLLSLDDELRALLRGENGNNNGNHAGGQP